MAFIRIKNIQEKPYAYLIKNKWTKKGPRQKSSKYLGPVIKLESKDNKPFSESLNNIELYFKEKSGKEILNDIIFCELKNYGFEEYKGKKGTKKLSMINSNIVVDLNNLKVYNVNDKKDVVIKLYSDFLCAYSLRKLYNFWEHGTEMEVAPKFGKAFISADIPIEDEIFVKLFQKLYKNDSLRVS